MQTIGFLNNNTKLQSNNTIVPIEFTHSCAIGQTGCGKTTSYIYPNLDDRIKQNHALVVLDYKGKEHNAVKYLANKHNRLDEIVEIGKDWGESINLIKYMPNGELENFLKSLFGLDGGDNEYWSISGANVSLAILDILGAIENVIKSSEKTNSKQKFEDIFSESCLEPYPTTKTLYSLSKVVKSTKTLNNFISNLELLISYIKDAFKDEIRSNKKISKKKLLEKYKQLSYNIEILKKTVNRSKQKLTMFTTFKSSSNNSKTFETILLAISTPLLNIANIRWLNDDKFDIVKGLDEKKIVVINTKIFSDFTLSAFVKSMFMELGKRTIYTDPNPISIFVDEAQRIVSRDFDIPIDILREAKVELFLAFQNSELMIEQLGENKYLSLLQNIKHRFIYKNPGMLNNYDLSILDIFEYYLDDSDDIKAKVAPTIFISKNELFNIELKYQKQINLHKRYNLEAKDNDKILIYNENLLGDGLLCLMDSKQQQYIKEYFIPELFEISQTNIFEIFNAKDEDTRDVEDILADFEKQMQLIAS